MVMRTKEIKATMQSPFVESKGGYVKSSTHEHTHGPDYVLMETCNHNEHENQKGRGNLHRRFHAEITFFSNRTHDTWRLLEDARSQQHQKKNQGF